MGIHHLPYKRNKTKYYNENKYTWAWGGYYEHKECSDTQSDPDSFDNFIPIPRASFPFSLFIQKLAASEAEIEFVLIHVRCHLECISSAPLVCWLAIPGQKSVFSRHRGGGLNSFRLLLPRGRSGSLTARLPGPPGRPFRVGG